MERINLVQSSAAQRIDLARIFIIEIEDRMIITIQLPTSTDKPYATPSLSRVNGLSLSSNLIHNLQVVDATTLLPLRRLSLPEQLRRSLLLVVR